MITRNDYCQAVSTHHNGFDSGYLIHQLHLMNLDIPIKARFTFVIKFLSRISIFEVRHTLEEFLKQERAGSKRADT